MSNIRSSAWCSWVTRVPNRHKKKKKNFISLNEGGHGIKPPFDITIDQSCHCVEALLNWVTTKTGIFRLWMTHTKNWIDILSPLSIALRGSAFCFRNGRKNVLVCGPILSLKIVFCRIYKGYKILDTPKNNICIRITRYPSSECDQLRQQKAPFTYFPPAMIHDDSCLRTSNKRGSSCVRERRKKRNWRNARRPWCSCARLLSLTVEV